MKSFRIHLSPVPWVIKSSRWQAAKKSWTTNQLQSVGDMTTWLTFLTMNKVAWFWGHQHYLTHSLMLIKLLDSIETHNYSYESLSFFSVLFPYLQSHIVLKYLTTVNQKCKLLVYFHSKPSTLRQKPLKEFNHFFVHEEKKLCSHKHSRPNSNEVHSKVPYNAQ